MDIKLQLKQYITGLVFLLRLLLKKQKGCITIICQLLKLKKHMRRLPRILLMQYLMDLLCSKSLTSLRRGGNIEFHEPHRFSSLKMGEWLTVQNDRYQQHSYA